MKIKSSKDIRIEYLEFIFKPPDNIQKDMHLIMF